MSNNNYAHLFNSQSQAYSKFRPSYPNELYEYFTHTLKTCNIAVQTVWECGCGSGQATADLANYFPKIYATDPSKNQLQYAPKLENVVYLNESAESAPSIPDNSCQFVVAMQAAHWFELPKFYAEADRILSNTGLIALVAYGLAETDDEQFDAKVFELYENVLGSYWDKNRAKIDNGYEQSLDFPYSKLKPPQLDITKQFVLSDYLHYIETWSAFQQYCKAKDVKQPQLWLRDFFSKFNLKSQLLVRWPLQMLIGKYEAK